VAQDNGQADRSFVAKTSFGYRGLFQPCRDYVKSRHVRGLPVGSVLVAYMDWCEKRMYHVYQVSPTGCTLIRIIMTLKYE
jgi:hypothetical protein